MLWLNPFYHISGKVLFWKSSKEHLFSTLESWFCGHNVSQPNTTVMKKQTHFSCSQKYRYLQQNCTKSILGASQVSACKHTLTSIHTDFVHSSVLRTNSCGFRGIHGKQVALKCYEIFRWHTRSNIYNMYNWG